MDEASESRTVAVIASSILETTARHTAASFEALTSTLTLAIEISRESGEGHRVGTLFTLGNAARVLAHSRPFILDPLQGHVPAATHVSSPELRGTVRELAQLDGAFVVADDGAVVAACRYLDVSSRHLLVPFGLGSRHMVAASISVEPGVVAIAVSQSGVVRVFGSGSLIAQI